MFNLCCDSFKFIINILNKNLKIFGQRRVVSFFCFKEEFRHQINLLFNASSSKDPTKITSKGIL